MAGWARRPLGMGRPWNRRRRRKSLGGRSARRRSKESRARKGGRRRRLLGDGRFPPREAALRLLPARRCGRTDGFTPQLRWARCGGSGSRRSARSSADGRSAIRWRRTWPIAVFRSPGATLIAPVTVGWPIGRRIGGLHRRRIRALSCLHPLYGAERGEDALGGRGEWAAARFLAPIDPRQCALAAICDARDVNSQMRAHTFGARR